MSRRLFVLAKETGFRGLFAGLGPRMVMTAGLVSSQFLMYGAVKDGEITSHFLLMHSFFQLLIFTLALGAPPGLEIHKED